VNFTFKHRYGDGLSAYTVKGRRAEITTKIVCHNLWVRLKPYFTKFSISPEKYKDILHNL